MNPTTSPRIALANTAIALLPQLTRRRLVDLSTEQRKEVFELAVSSARELFRLCDYRDDAITATELRMTVDRAIKADTDSVKPEWTRLPGLKGRCPYSGLSRSALYMLISPSEENGYSPPVRSICLRRRGAVRGVRLIHVQSLLDFLGAQSA